MSRPDEMEGEDTLTFDLTPLRGRHFEVSDVTVEDIGLTEIVAVSLVSDSERWAIEWATHSETANLVRIDGDEEYEITLEHIVVL